MLGDSYLDAKTEDRTAGGVTTGYPCSYCAHSIELIYSVPAEMSREGDSVNNFAALKRERLYGAARLHARNAAKKLLERDHVTENFQKGVEAPSGKAAFCSETGLSFRVRKAMSFTTY